MPAVADHKVLGGLPLFHGLPGADLARINDRLRSSRFTAGAPVLTASQTGEAVYIVRTGTLKVHIIREDGHEVTLALLGPGELVGEMALLDLGGRSANVVALESAELLWLDRATFHQLRRDIPLITDNLLAILARRLRLANAHFEALATLDVFGRVARQLIGLAEAYGEPVPGGGVRLPFRLTQGELANLIGATRVRVNQVLVDFKRRGYLTEDAGHRITVLNQAALEDFCR
ncbi:MAG: Crp/Fnr family transcriptional regulator [Chloroflexota bacterium]|nr:Crp/Fnr family transcriptional regulator [Chloroflexota bacterium]